MKKIGGLMQGRSCDCTHKFRGLYVAYIKKYFFCVFPIYFCLTNLDKPVPGPMKKYFPGNGNHHCNFLSLDMLFWQAFCYQPVVCEDNWVGAFTKKTETTNASEKPRKKKFGEKDCCSPGWGAFCSDPIGLGLSNLSSKQPKNLGAVTQKLQWGEPIEWFSWL